MDAARDAPCFEFAGLRLYPHERVLRRPDDGAVALAGKPFDALVHLVENAGAPVTRSALTKALWPTTVVEDANLNVVISALRRALAAEAPGQRFVVTLARRGYQFVIPVQRRSAASSRAAPKIAAARPPPPADGAEPIDDVNPARVAGDRPVLAVLPFRSLSPTGQGTSLELGMAETLIAGLQGDTLAVIPLSAVRRFAAADQDALAAGHAVGARVVLEGYVQHEGDRLRVSVRLIDVADGRTLWQAQFDQRFGDIFAVQDSVADRVRASLTPEVVAGAAAGLLRHTRDPEAYRLYMDGRFHRWLPRTPSNLEAALEKFRQATERDPGFALAYVGASEVRGILGVFGIRPPHETFPAAMADAERAVSLAPGLGEAYSARGHARVQYELDWTGAEADFRRALKMNRYYAPAWQWYGILHGLHGRFDEGIRCMRRAHELDPGSITYLALVGLLLSYARRHDEAIAELRRAVELAPGLATAHTYLAAAYLRSGRPAEAEVQLELIASTAPGVTAYRGQAHALTGRRASALAEVQRLEALACDSYVSAYDIASIHAALGDADRTFAWLERAFEERAGLLAWLPWDAVFDGLRTDPRYGPLAARLPGGQ